MVGRLTSILAEWQANHGTLDELVEQVEAALLTEAQAWILGMNELVKARALSPAEDASPDLELHSASHPGRLKIDLG